MNRAALIAALAIAGGVVLMPRKWTYPLRAAPFIPTIESAEGMYAIPPKLLGRLLYQESRFRADIIDGTVKSSAGAVGIAQIVPKWHPSVDPLDPYQSIYYAAEYLATLKSQFGTWDKALAAYNWGPGNLSRVERDENWQARLPDETRNYVAEITRDTGLAVA